MPPRLTNAVHGPQELTWIGPLPVQFSALHPDEFHAGLGAQALFQAALLPDQGAVHTVPCKAPGQRQGGVDVPARATRGQHHIGPSRHSGCSARLTSR